GEAHSRHVWCARQGSRWAGSDRRSNPRNSRRLCTRKRVSDRPFRSEERSIAQKERSSYYRAIMRQNNDPILTRRAFAKLTLAGVPACVFLTPLALSASAKINSRIKGVQIGAITYSFRSMTAED